MAFAVGGVDSPPSGGLEQEASERVRTHLLNTGVGTSPGRGPVLVLTREK